MQADKPTTTTPRPDETGTGRSGESALPAYDGDGGDEVTDAQARNKREPVLEEGERGGPSLGGGEERSDPGGVGAEEDMAKAQVRTSV